MGKHQKGGLEQAVYQLIRPLIHLIWDDYQLCVVAFFRTIKSLSINAAHNSLYSLSIFPANVHRSCLYGLWALPSSTQNLKKTSVFWMGPRKSWRPYLIGCEFEKQNHANSQSFQGVIVFVVSRTAVPCVSS
jgi:hypothetical protein